MDQSHFSGVQYFSKGWSLIRLKGVRHFVILPLMVNLILLTSASIWLFNQLLEWKDEFYQWSWSWVQTLLDWFGWLLWPILLIVIFIAVFYFFAMIANWLAAPFNGLLSEAVERHLRGHASDDGTSFKEVIADLPRILRREWAKFLYWLPRALLCLLCFLLPVINLVAPLIWIVFSAWMMAIQYIDYPMDNHKVPFNTMLYRLKQRKTGPLGFGGMVTLFTMIPVVNLLVMPIAVAGATALWFDHYRDENAGSTLRVD
ncbi:MAG: sulfate transporter CysZ [Gammaproteobacteria bacterium]|nr:sulfate transporter CysZ [Gammaproteobacteria bacterium]